MTQWSEGPEDGVLRLGRWAVRTLMGWLRTRDGDLRATRRAARTALVMPTLFALGFVVARSPNLATFAAFGSFALLLLADFGGSLTLRLAAQSGLITVGCVLIPLATLAALTPWTAALAMFVVGFVVLFAGVVSSALAGASTAILLSFILPVATPTPVGSVPDRLLGWLLAGVVSLAAVVLLWPAPRREPLRDAAAEACLQLSARLTAEAARLRTGGGGDVATAVARSEAAVAGLRKTFLATPYRPAGLSTSTRAVVRLVDEIAWLNLILLREPGPAHHRRVEPTVLAVKAAAAVLLEHAGKALRPADPPQDSLRDHLADLARARRAVEAAAIAAISLPPTSDGELIGSLSPSFHAQEVSFGVTAIAANIEIAVAAEARCWWQKLLGGRPPGLAGPLASARERLVSHLDPQSVWLRNSIRGAIALGGAVLVADLTGVQHSFWIVLGALSVLRSNALSTGQNAVRGLAGTAIGFVIGSALVLLIGTTSVALWTLLPVAILAAGIAPAVSFTAGQAGFTVTLLVLFNIISPAGWRVGLIRIEDVAIGCAVSLVVGVLFWPRGAAGALRAAIGQAYVDSAAYLRAAAGSGAPIERSPEATATAQSRAAAAARRLDDAFREFLAERGRKRLTLPEVAALLTGVAGLRLTADAARDLWFGDAADLAPGRVGSPRAQHELLAATERVTNWYAALAQAVVGAGTVPPPLPRDEETNTRLVTALLADLPGAAGPVAGATAARAQIVRMVWTSDHVDVARRLQQQVAEPARTAAAGRGRTDRFRLPRGRTDQRLWGRTRITEKPGRTPDPHPRQGADMPVQPDDAKPTIVLVHGAWADATGFDRQIRALQDRGFRAVGFGNPLRGLPGDATYLAEFLRTLTGPIVLVGHSYGGMVISVAATGNDQVKALVYLNGWMLDEGETQLQLLERFEGSLVGPAIRPVPYTRPDGSGDADLYLDPTAFREAFAGDVDEATAAAMAAAQRPFANAAFTGPSGAPAWKTGTPCWYLLGTQDNAIPPALQRFMAERANATIVEVPASHVSFVSQPEAALQLILQAVEATAPAGAVPEPRSQAEEAAATAQSTGQS